MERKGERSEPWSGIPQFRESRRGGRGLDGVSPWISILGLTSGRWMVVMPHGQTAKVSVSGSGLSRHGAWRRREADFRREGRSRIVFVLAGAGLPKPRLAGACVGADGKSFPSAAGNARAEPIGRDAGLAGNFQPGVEQPLSAAGACVPRALQGGAGGGRAGGGRALLQKRGGLHPPQSGACRIGGRRSWKISGLPVE